LIYSSSENFSGSKVHVDTITAYGSEPSINEKPHRSIPSNTGEISVTILFFLKKIYLLIH
jgi:hypothetical protein